MCASIATACSKLGSSASYPLGATIDARGFTGNQVCHANTITTMLFQCVPQGSSTGATGGKLLLGEVNLYADGPTSGHYTDGSSGIGTPALIIPGSFWGIEGVSRGASVPMGANMGPGTWLSVCTGTNTPVGTGHLPPAPGSPSCSTAFPVRTFNINNITVTGSNPTLMTITITTAVTAYGGELVMVKGAPGGAPPSGNDGTFAIQSVVPGTGGSTLISVAVPPLTPACGSGCGSIYLGTPILGFASSNTPYNDPSCFPSGCVGFGEHIQNLGFNCQTLDGCIGWQNL